VPRGDKFNTLMCQLFRNSGTSTSCSPKGLSRPVQGLRHIMQMKSQCIQSQCSHNRRIQACCVPEAKDKNFALLGYYAVSSGNFPSSGQAFVTPEGGTARLSRNVDQNLPLLAA
jgi:hypothetical protein